jgi:hypothetical protein
MLKAILGTLVVAAVSTASDYTWFEIGVGHSMLAGVVTGAVMLMAVGGVVGWMARRMTAGLWLGIVAGVMGALAYFAMQPALGSTTAMMAAWAGLWLVLSIGEARVLRSPRRPWVEALGRGVLAAVLSGAAFYLVVGSQWVHVPSRGRNYAMQYVRWIVAWAPGILTLGWPGRSGNR